MPWFSVVTDAGAQALGWRSQNVLLAAKAGADAVATVRRTRPEARMMDMKSKDSVSVEEGF